MKKALIGFVIIAVSTYGVWAYLSRGLGGMPIFPEQGIQSFPDSGYSDYGELLFRMNPDGTWSAWQTDYDNEEGCSWGEKSGVAEGTWEAKSEMYELSLGQDYGESQMRPLVALEGATMRWTRKGWMLKDALGFEVRFWDESDYHHHVHR